MTGSERSCRAGAHEPRPKSYRALNPQEREAHRAEIRRRMYRFIYRRWRGLLGALMASVVVVSFGLSIFPIPNERRFGVVLIMAGILLFCAYLWGLRAFRSNRIKPEWLKPLDQVVVGAIACLVGVLPGRAGALSPLLVVVAAAYAYWRLFTYARPCWKDYFFRAGREYLREIWSDRRYRAFFAPSKAEG